jgi:2-desacetyl-2-hydroxyethyl bacteriochlorophyllide A dehydrogenase
MQVKQIVFDALDRISIHRIEANILPAPGEVVVAPAIHGICGTDLHLLHGRHPWIRPPVVTGHESVGTVALVGEGVTDWRPGDRVLINPLVSCGHCRQCGRGQPNHCPDAKVLGFRLPGTAQTRFAIGARQLHRLPPALSFEAAALAEPLAVGLHAATRAADLEEVLVIGGGTIGLVTLIGLKSRGARRVTVIEPVPAKRALAERLGATRTAPPGGIEAAAQFTAVFDVVADQETIAFACGAAATGGAVVMVGVPAAARSLPVPRLQRFEIDLHGSGLYLNHEIYQSIAVLAAGHVETAALTTAAFSLDAVQEAYRVAQLPTSVKVLVHMD